MAMTTEPQKGVMQLERLQKMLNEVLEQTGRLFKDAASGNVATAQAHGTRLKLLIPKTNTSFHDTLDELETQIAVARAVLRRDLATIRAEKTAQISVTKTEDVAASREIKPDIEMGEAEPTDDRTKDNESAANAVDLTSSGLDVKEEVPNDEPVDHEQKSTGQTNGHQDLHVDTEIPNSTTNAADPTTANTAFDFDSLFNDSASASGTGEANTPIRQAEPDEQPTKFEPEDEKNDTKVEAEAEPEPDFSFNAFNEQNPSDNNKNEDISSLLPGLESYANEEPESQPADYNMTDVPNNAGAENEGQNADQDADLMGGEMRDTTFDDLMNFDGFDMGALGDGGGDESRFDEDFFNIE